jgi:5-formyltetrahydrofolate cyclo-ligase
MKEELRKYFFSLRKNKYFNLKEKDFKPLVSEIARHNKNSIIGSYYSINFELDLKILNTFLFTKGFSLSLPFIHKDNELMEFKEWNSSDVLQLNKYGIPQMFLDSKTIIPDIFLVPLLAFDKCGNRLGYGSGYYDKYFNMLNKTKKRFRTIGVGFSFQKKDKLQTLKTDFCLDAVFTEKGFLNIK